MAFRMVCPKCDTMDYSIERDRRAYAHGGEAADLIYSCRCGKRMFGDQVLKEYERQKKEWASDTSARNAEVQERQKTAHEREQREAEMREAMAYRARIRAEREHEEHMRREEEMRRWRERIEAGGGKVPPPPPPSPKPRARKLAAAPVTPASSAAPVTQTAASPPAASEDVAAPVKAAKTTKVAKPKAEAKPAGELPKCAWEECDKPGRSNSKYCSRECSNKNARARHRKRKTTD